MAANVDLSLDEIIKLNKKQNAGKPKPNRKQPKPNLSRLRNLGARSGIVSKGGPKQTSNQGTTMLLVSNLHYNVSNDDVRELFNEIGTIKKAAVHYDKSGRSLGTAEVIFSSRAEALKAIQKYHNLPLDGRPMNISLVPSSTNVRSPTKSRIGVKAGSGIYKRPQNRNIKGGQQVQKGRRQNDRGTKPPLKRGGNQRQQRKPVTAEQLDADLEAYTMNVE